MWSVRCCNREGQQRFEQRRTVRQARAFLVDDFDLFTFEDSDVGIFAEAVKTAMLDYKQTRFDVLDHEAEAGNFARRSPDSQLIAVIPHAEMYLRTFHCGCELGENADGQRQRMLKH